MMHGAEQISVPVRNKVFTEADFDGYSAAPLLIIGEDAIDDLRDGQDRLAYNFERASEQLLTPYAKESVVKFVSRSIASRMHQREGLNGSSYHLRKNYTPDLHHGFKGATPDEVELAVENAKFGMGSVLQNELARRALGMESVEYANLTVVGEFRREMEPKMWEEVSELVGHDASPSQDDVYRTYHIGFDRDITTSKHIGALRFGIKRRIGELDDGTIVKSRTTAIINTRPYIDGKNGLNPELTPELIDAFREVEVHNKSIEEQEDIDRIDWARENVRRVEAGLPRLEFVKPEYETKSIVELPGFKSLVARLINTKLEPGVVLARNETIYGVNHTA